MAKALKWSPEAIEDLQSIAEYIARDSAFYATAVVENILSIAESLQDHPESGRVVPEIGMTNIRERFVYSFRLIYRDNPRDVLVVAIIHGNRLLEPHLERIRGKT